MDKVDRDHIKRVVYEASKDSPHFANEQRKEEQAARRVAELQAKRRVLLPRQLEGFRAEAAKCVAELESKRDLTRWIFHVDMDAFYASCHILENPSLASIPMAVGGIGMIRWVQETHADAHIHTHTHTVSH